MSRIDGEALIAAIKNEMCGDGCGGSSAVCGCCDIRHICDLIRDQPTVEQPRWIPVAERMPPDDTDVLLCRGEECVVGRWFTADEEDEPHWISNADFDGWHMNVSEPPTHWQPLPEPPKED